MPPTINESQTNQVVETTEHSNVNIQCKANGHPRPGVVWRRDDGTPIKLSGRFNKITSKITGASDIMNNDNDSSTSFKNSTSVTAYNVNANSSPAAVGGGLLGGENNNDHNNNNENSGLTISGVLQFSMFTCTL